jgi:hypothetical protein
MRSDGKMLEIEAARTKKQAARVLRGWAASVQAKR